MRLTPLPPVVDRCSALGRAEFLWLFIGSFWAFRFAFGLEGRGPGKSSAPRPAEPVPPNTVSLVQKNQKIEPQMNRMDADGQRKNPIVISILHLRPSVFICG
jgi:hypothetical protein